MEEEGKEEARLEAAAASKAATGVTIATTATGPLSWWTSRKGTDDDDGDRISLLVGALSSSLVKKTVGATERTWK